MKIATTYEFCSAHRLPKVPETHKCFRMHGHNYKLLVELIDRINPDTGMVLDFFDLDAKVRPLVEAIDHRCLNDIEGLENPTAELIATWFAMQLREAFGENVELISCRVYETPDCYAEASI